MTRKVLGGLHLKIFLKILRIMVT